jgi:hypothetical protein
VDTFLTRQSHAWTIIPKVLEKQLKTTGIKYQDVLVIFDGTTSVGRPP